MSIDNSGRINVSEDRLRGVIAEFELSLREFIDRKLESKADLLMLNEARKTIQDMEQAGKEWRKTVEGRFNSLERWRSGLAAVVAVIVFAIPVAAVIVAPHIH